MNLDKLENTIATWLIMNVIGATVGLVIHDTVLFKLCFIQLVSLTCALLLGSLTI